MSPFSERESYPVQTLKGEVVSLVSKMERTEPFSLLYFVELEGGSINQEGHDIGNVNLKIPLEVNTFRVIKKGH